MKKLYDNSKLLTFFLVPIAGLVVLAFCYVGYFAAYMFAETVFFPNIPTSVPAGIIRNSYALCLLVIYLFLLRTKIFELSKAIILIGPVTMVIIAVNLAFYLQPFFAIVSTSVIAICCLFLIKKYKKPWVYYYAIAISTIAAIFYAWPRG